MRFGLAQSICDGIAGHSTPCTPLLSVHAAHRTRRRRDETQSRHSSHFPHRKARLDYLRPRGPWTVSLNARRVRGFALAVKRQINDRQRSRAIFSDRARGDQWGRNDAPDYAFRELFAPFRFPRKLFQNGPVWVNSHNRLKKLNYKEHRRPRPLHLHPTHRNLAFLFENESDDPWLTNSAKLVYLGSHPSRSRVFGLSIFFPTDASSAANVGMSPS